MKQQDDPDAERDRPGAWLFAGLPLLKIIQPTTAWATGTPGSQLELCGSALFYAQRGWPVFPCTPARRNGEGGKSPRIKDWQRLATIEREQIIDWWSDLPTSNVGVVCGPKSGLLVIDIDYKPHRGIDGVASLAALEKVHGPLPTGPRVRRGSSSTHAYHQYDDRLRNYVGHVPGIDVRTAGGFIVAALSFHAQSGDQYGWIDGTAELPVPKAPEWLIEVLLKPAVVGKRNKAPRAVIKRSSDELPHGAKAYAAAALASEVENVAEAEEGTRNSTLNRAAFSMGTLLGANAIDREDVENALLDAALECGLSEEEAEATINSGLDAGERQPRDLDHLGRMPRGIGFDGDDEIDEDLK